MSPRVTSLALVTALGACANAVEEPTDAAETPTPSLEVIAPTDAPAPEPVLRGSYRIVEARAGETLASVARRTRQDAAALASFNGITPQTVLRAGDEIVLLP